MKKNILFFLTFFVMSLSLYTQDFSEVNSLALEFDKTVEFAQKNNPKLYRSILPPESQKIYDQIYEMIKNHEQKRLVTDVKLLVKDFRAITECVNYDNPDLFWWENTATFISDAKNIVEEISIPYLIKDENLEEAKSKVYLELKPVIFYASLIESDIDKIKYVHDYFCNNVVYNEYAKRTGRAEGLLQTVYSAIVNKNTVCSGYCRSFQLCMNILGIPCSILTSSTHSWNIVKVNDSWYEVDITSDAEGTDSIPKMFLIDRQTMSKFENHYPSYLTKDVLLKYPSNDKEFSYTKHFGYVKTCEPYTFKEFEQLIPEDFKITDLDFTGAADGVFSSDEDVDGTSSDSMSRYLSQKYPDYKIITTQIHPVTVYDSAETVIDLIKKAVMENNDSSDVKIITVSVIVEDSAIKNKVVSWFTNQTNLAQLVAAKFGKSRVGYSYSERGKIKYIELDLKIKAQPVK